MIYRSNCPEKLQALPVPIHSCWLVARFTSPGPDFLIGNPKGLGQHFQRGRVPRAHQLSGVPMGCWGHGREASAKIPACKQPDETIPLILALKTKTNF